MKQGALIYDKESGHYDIRFGLNDYNGGLHCGECFDVFAGGRWKPTRIEMSMEQNGILWVSRRTYWTACVCGYMTDSRGGDQL